MKARQVFVVWGLLAVSLLAIGGSTLVGWYGMTSDSLQTTGGGSGGNNQAPSGFPSCFPFCTEAAAPAQEDIDPPRYRLHTTFWTDAHEGGEGGGHEAMDYQQVPWIAQVMSVFRIFFLLGAVGLALASVGLVLRLKGLAGAKGLLATLAALSLAAMVFAVAHFAVMLPDAYNRELEDGTQTSPEIAFWTVNGGSESGLWQNVTAGPDAGWYFATIGMVAGGGAFVVAFANDLRRARDVLVNDDAAHAAYEASTEQRRHVMERIRGGGGS